MSKAVHIRKINRSSVRSQDTAPAQADGYDAYDDYAADDEYEGEYEAEYEGEDEYAEEVEPHGPYRVGAAEASPGLFGSPGRAVALGGAVLMLVVVMAVVALLLTTRQPPPPPTGIGTQVGQQAPDFNLVDVRTNQTVSLASLRGKPVFINFWGTWCPPCRAEMPEMQRVYDQYKGQVEIVGISMAPRDTTDMVKNFVDQEKYTWTFIHDATNQAQIDYQAFQIPTSYFLDKNGIVRAFHIGAMNAQQMEGYIQKAQAAR